MADLVEWLRAQLDEDEQVARASDTERHRQIVTKVLDGSPGSHFQAALIARWDPARMLAEVDAKRRILDQLEMWLWGHDPERASEYPGTTGGVAAMLTVVRTLALPYADRVGYRDEWRP